MKSVFVFALVVASATAAAAQSNSYGTRGLSGTGSNTNSHYVSPHVNSHGTYVPGHQQTNPCDKPPSKELAPAESVTNQTGRWAVVPASNGPTVVAGTTYFFAWRLDTKIGDLELCTYDSGGWQNVATRTIAPERLTCTEAVKASP